MQVKVKYSDYLTPKGNKVSDSYELQIDENVTIKLEVNRVDMDSVSKDDGIPTIIQPLPSCKITIEDSLTLDTVECSIPQNEYRDFVQVVREIATQFNM